MLRVMFVQNNSLYHIEKIQFFESVKKGFNLLSRIQQKRVQFFESYQNKEFNSFSYIQKKGSILWVIYKKKGIILWVKFKQKVQFCESTFEKRSNSLRHIWTKGPILCVKLKKRVQFGVSYWKKSIRVKLKKSSILCVWKKKSSILWVISKKVQFFVSKFQKKFNSLSHIKGSILWVILKKKSSTEKMFNSWSHILKKGSIIWVILKTKVECLESYKKSSIRRVIFQKNHFFESYLMKKSLSRIIEGFNSLSRSEKDSILRVKFEKKRFNFFLSHIWKKRFSSASQFLKKKIWVILKRTSIL